MPIAAASSTLPQAKALRASRITTSATTTRATRGTCTAHYIREDVLREIVLERIRAVNEYIRSDVDGFQEEWLQCRRTDQERSIRDDKKKLEQAKKRLADLDVIIARLYEDYVLGNLNQDRYRKMSADYEAEQERLKLEIEVIEEWVEQREEMNDGLDAFIALTQKICGCGGADTDHRERVYQENHRLCPGQIQRQAQAESEDFSSTSWTM